jgi:hypothetical protein
MAVSSALIVVALATSSGAEPNGPVSNVSNGLSPEDRVAQEAQAPYMILGQAVDAINVDLGGERLGDYVAIDVPGRAMDVAWVGDVPRELRALATTAAREGIELRIRPTTNSIAEMRIHAQELARAGDLDRLALGPDRITIYSPDLASEHQKALHGEAVAPHARGFFDHAAAVAQTSGFAVAFSNEGEEEWYNSAGRYDGAAPFRAGAAYRGAGSGSECTMGFQARIGTSKYFITAAHCGGARVGGGYNDNATANAWSTNQVIGRADYVDELYNNRPDKYDLAVVRLDFANVGEVLNDSLQQNPVFNTSTLVVQNVANPIIGAEYCSSGNYTKSRCGLIVEGQFIVGCNAAQTACEYSIGVRTIRYTGAMWCQGDSGGPVYYYPNGLTASRATAVGIITKLRGATTTLTSGRICTVQDGNGYAFGGMSVVTTATSIVPGLQVIYTP